MIVGWSFLKIIKYSVQIEYNIGTEEEPVIEKRIVQREVIATDENLDVQTDYAKAESYDGVITIEDDSQPEPEPTELEQLRADLDFLSVMTGVSL